MKSIENFKEDLTDRRQQLLQKQKAQKQSAAERGVKARAAFEKNVADEQEQKNKRQQKEREKEEIKREVKKELEKEEE